jgi:hypothetical protein
MWAIQSVLLNKNKFPNRTASSVWIRNNDFKVNINPNPNKADNKYYRYRQRQPDEFKKTTFRQKSINNYLSIVYGELKKKSK